MNWWKKWAFCVLVLLTMLTCTFATAMVLGLIFPGWFAGVCTVLIIGGVIASLITEITSEKN